MQIFDFEENLVELNEQLEKLKEISKHSDIDISTTINQLENLIEEKKISIYQNITAWQKVQISRHPERPYTLSYINYLTKGDFIELHGDRYFKDDKAMVGGFGIIEDQTVMFIGQQKGENTKQRQLRNFGMSNPEGYRKALRLMKLAEKFNKPIVAFVDTPGAFPGIEAEERGQAEAIAKNLFEMFKIKVPIIVVIIGEGASGGAIGIGVGDRIFMLEHTWYSVISPESCSQILWRSWDSKKQAANALKLTSDEMFKNKLIDGIIKEPLGGAHYNPTEIFNSVKEVILEQIKELSNVDKKELVKQRIEKFSNFGVFLNK